ncbi:MAG: hypothetical protein L6R41_001202 [Letrouitia leprolyta]|nr:MAG: hypothetical protein L6R41_001202 [Letrouitia leprolyta]
MPPSNTYDNFTAPIRNSGGAGFDENEEEVKYAENLRERIIQEFRELSTYKVHYQPIGPHPIAMFEVDIANPAQFGAFVPWLAIHHGPLSILVHPNMGDDLLGHTQHAMWIGEKLSLKLIRFEEIRKMKEVAAKKLQHAQEESQTDT